MMIPRALGAASMSVVLAAGVAAPAMAAAHERAPRAASMAVKDATPVNPACTALTTDLVGQISSASTGLLGVPPNVSAVTGLVGTLLGDVTALQSAGCLPAVPPAAGTTPTACVPDTATLLSDVFALLADLTSTPPNVTGAVSELTAALSSVSGLINAGCLPSVPLPTLPTLPARSLPRAPSVRSVPAM